MKLSQGGLLLATLTLAACASVSPQYATLEKGKTSYVIKSVDVTLTEGGFGAGTPAPEYPGQPELGALFQDDLQRQLGTQGLAGTAGQSYQLAVHINYMRVMVRAHEYGGFHTNYRIDVLTPDGQTWTTIKEDGDLIVNKGLFGNIANVGQIIAGSKGPKDEAEDVMTISRYLANQLPSSLRSGS